MGEPPREMPRTRAAAGFGHETSDVRIRPLAIFLAWLMGIIVAAACVCAWLFSLLERGAEQRDPAPPPLADSAERTRGPLLQVSPRQDLEVLRAREERQLHATEWVDKDRRIARIPIDRAIAVTVERGLPKWPEVKGEAAKPGAGDRTPMEPAARSSAGTGQTTPPAEAKQ
jgi:hypothetical protein